MTITLCIVQMSFYFEFPFWFSDRMTRQKGVYTSSRKRLSGWVSARTDPHEGTTHGVLINAKPLECLQNPEYDPDDDSEQASGRSTPGAELPFDEASLTGLSMEQISQVIDRLTLVAGKRAEQVAKQFGGDKPGPAPDQVPGDGDPGHDDGDDGDGDDGDDGGSRRVPKKPKLGPEPGGPPVPQGNGAHGTAQVEIDNADPSLAGPSDVGDANRAATDVVPRIVGSATILKPMNIAEDWPSSSGALFSEGGKRYYRVPVGEYNRLQKLKERYNRDSIAVFPLDHWEEIQKSLIPEGHVAVPPERVIPDDHVAVPQQLIDVLNSSSEMVSRLALMLNVSSESLRKIGFDISKTPVKERPTAKELSKSNKSPLSVLPVGPSASAAPVKPAELKLEMPDEGEDLVCSQCHKKFEFRSSLETHLKSHMGKREFECSKCHSMLSTKKSLKLHEDHCIHGKFYTCSHSGCGKQYSSKSGLKRHEEDIHGVKAPVQHCKHGCGKSYDKPNSLRSHEKDCPKRPGHTGSYVCGVCGATRSRASDLTSHMREHGIRVMKPLKGDKVGKPTGDGNGDGGAN